MDLDERIGIEQDMNLQLGPDNKVTMSLSTLNALIIIISQYKVTNDEMQLIEDMATIGIQVVK